MKIKIFPITIIFLFIIIFIVFLKGLKNPNIYTPTTEIKKNIPSLNFELFDSTEKINSSKIFAGDKFYLMNIWSSWCVPCRDEHVFLINLSKEKNLKIIGLNYKDNVINAKNFLDEFNNPYEIIISDKDGLVAIEWGAYGVPETFLIKEKKIIKKIIGPINDDYLIEIKELIK